MANEGSPRREGPHPPGPRSRARLRDHASTAALFLLASLAFVALLACEESEPAERGDAFGATVEGFQTADGIALDGRLWHRGSSRIAIYLHEYRQDQSAWWEVIRRQRAPGVSALTFDFRGHGESEGLLEDVEGMVMDAEAAIAFARGLGFERVMLVGAGMGAAIAMATAVQEPDVTVVGFSAPADFDALDTVPLAEVLDTRVQLIASRDDVSAAHSLRSFRALGNIDSTQARLYPGRSHGVRMLEGRAGADVRERFEELLRTFWLDPAT